MFTGYIIVSVLNAFANGYGTWMDFNSPKVKESMKKLKIPLYLLPLLGGLKFLEAIGLISAIFIPQLRLVTSCCLIVFIVFAIAAHLRVGDYNIKAAVIFLILSILTFILSLYI